MNRLPQSPMNSRARGRFQIQEPASAPASETSSMHERRTERRAEQRGEKRRRDDRHAGRQAVHVVEQVHRVAEPREPHRADQRVGGRQRAVRLCPGEREDEKRADGERRHELGDRRQLQAIVVETDDEHRQRGQQHPRPRRARRCGGWTRQPDQDEAGDRAIAIAIPPIVGVDALLQRSGRGGTTAPTHGRHAAYTAPIATAAASGNHEAENCNHNRRRSLIEFTRLFARGLPCRDGRMDPSPRMPSQIVSSPSDSPGRRCFRDSSLRL